MKTITMDFETYQKELEATEDRLSEMFEKGAIHSNKRLKPLIDYAIKIQALGVFSCNDLKDILEEAGEL